LNYLAHATPLVALKDRFHLCQKFGQFVATAAAPWPGHTLQNACEAMQIFKF